MGRMKKSSGNRLGAAVMLGGAAAGAGIGAVANKGCTRSDSAWAGSVRGMEVAGLAGGLALAASKKYRRAGYAAIGGGAVIALLDVFGVFKGLNACQ